MTTAGPNFPGASSGANALIAAGGGTIGVPDFSFVVAYNFGFSIPTGATINSITLLINGASGFSDNVYVRVTKAQPTPVGDPVTVSETNWPNQFKYVDYTLAPTLFGLSWTAAEINSSGFGFYITADPLGEFGGGLSMDYVTCAIDYTAGTVTVGEARKTFKAAARVFNFATQTRDFIFKAKKR